MPTYTLPQDSQFNFSLGIDQVFLYVQQQFPYFSSLILFCFFLIIFLAGYTLQKKSEGKGDTLMWGTIASFMTFILALIMSAMPGFVDISVVITTLVIFTVLGLIYMISER